MQVLPIAVVTVAVSVAALSADLKVYISADMEGIGGVSTWDVQAEAKGREYEKFRRLMTLEVNAAVEAAFDAGATEVLVSDSHGDAQNIDIELLDKRARLIRSWPRPLGMMQGIDETFAAAAMIGYHAGEGSSPGVLAHTFTGKVSVALNGTAMPEAGISAAIAGEFGVPIVFVSGDQVITRETKRLLGNLETATVKEAIGFSSAIMMHPELAQRMIREGMKRGIERRGQMKPYRLTHPVKLQLTFKDLIDAEHTAFFPGVERMNGTTVTYTVRDMVEAQRFMEAVLHPVH
jgi:D-amino peptidase